MRRPTLRRRLFSLLVRWFLLFLVLSGAVGFFSFVQFRKEAVQERLFLAQVVAHQLDTMAEKEIHGLDRLATALSPDDGAVLGQLRAFRTQNRLGDAVYVLDEHGKKVFSDPAFAEPIPPQLAALESVTPLFRKHGDKGHPYLAIVRPFQRANHRHLLVSEMNPLGSMMSTFLQGMTTQPDMEVFVVDLNGVVLAAPDQSRLFRTMPQAELVGERISARRPFVSEDLACEVCDMLGSGDSALTVMVPLRLAPWGVVVQQRKSQAFAALYTSQYGFLAAGMLSLLMGVFVSRALLKSVVSPIRALSDQAESMRRGDLTNPIEISGDHEITVLATTLDEARQRVCSTLDELRSLNETLEAKVANRTWVLKEQYESQRLLHAASEICTREPEAARFVPQILRLVAEYHGHEAMGLVTLPLDSPPATYVHPHPTALPWLRADADPPDGWLKLKLVYQDEVQGLLFCPESEKHRESVMDALQQQLALSLHGTYLMQRTMAQDRQRRTLVRRLLDAGEEERKRIARELHDEISQLLTVIGLSLDDMGLDTADMKKAKALLLRTQAEIHRIIYDLRPSVLDDLGLSAAVRWYATNYLAKQGLAINLEVEEDLDLPPEIEIVVFRIYQEIVTNILRHAHAESVSVELYLKDDKLVLAVEDDGVGFAADDKFEGAGLVGMRERAALVNGTISFSSEPDMGSQVTLVIPTAR